ncbi:unnamed protein product [Cylindrotheca closterium]|uniref:Uncharacterized protein n=1 Tax=Cylindrotheca closterium TaxID=2856 RepID=A0AAD2FM03_9STRA|nr:unnamed protein product [Cylindrotheca closterium]
MPHSSGEKRGSSSSSNDHENENQKRQRLKEAALARKQAEAEREMQSTPERPLATNTTVTPPSVPTEEYNPAGVDSQLWKSAGIRKALQDEQEADAGADAMEQEADAGETTVPCPEPPAPQAPNGATADPQYLPKEEQLEILRRSATKEMIHMNLNKFVGKRIFPNAKFPLSELHNKAVCKLAVGSEVVRLDQGVDPEVFAEEYHKSVKERMAALRLNCHNAARSKFLNDLKLDKVPSDSLVVDLLEKNTDAAVGYRSCGQGYRDYLTKDGTKVLQARTGQYQSFHYLVKRIMPSINCTNTKFDVRKQEETISNIFTVSDEAFALVLLENYESRWRKQHEDPKSARLRGKEHAAISKEFNAKFTSSDDGLKLKSSGWSRQGIESYNEKLSSIGKLRRQSRTGAALEEYELWKMRGGADIYVKGTVPPTANERQIPIAEGSLAVLPEALESMFAEV